MVPGWSIGKKHFLNAYRHNIYRTLYLRDIRPTRSPKRFRTTRDGANPSFRAYRYLYGIDAARATRRGSGGDDDDDAPFGSGRSPSLQSPTATDGQKGERTLPAGQAPVLRRSVVPLPLQSAFVGVRVRKCLVPCGPSRRRKWNFRRAHYTSRPSGKAKRSEINESRWTVSICPIAEIVTRLRILNFFFLVNSRHSTVVRLPRASLVVHVVGARVL